MDLVIRGSFIKRNYIKKLSQGSYPSFFKGQDERGRRLALEKFHPAIACSMYRKQAGCFLKNILLGKYTAKKGVK